MTKIEDSLDVSLRMATSGLCRPVLCSTTVMTVIEQRRGRMDALALRAPAAGPVAGRFGRHGGRFVPEPLVPACDEVEAAFAEAWADPGFRGSLARLLSMYAGRPTPLTAALRLSAELGVAVLLKREDLAHTGSHKINNVLGQALLARRMGKGRLIA